MWWSYVKAIDMSMFKQSRIWEFSKHGGGGGFVTPGVLPPPVSAID